MKFDSVEASTKLTMIQYFQEDLKPSIEAKMDQRGRELDSFKELVERAVEAQTKGALQPVSYTHKTDQHCLRENRLAHINVAKAKTQKIMVKDQWVKKLMWDTGIEKLLETIKTQDLKPLLCSSRSENVGIVTSNKKF